MHGIQQNYNEFTQNTCLLLQFIGKTLTNRKSLTSLGIKLSALVQHAIYMP